MDWRWILVALASMSPNLVFGQQMAAYFGIKWGLAPIPLMIVMFVFGYASGFFWIWLGGIEPTWKWLHRFVVWMRKPRAVKYAQNWGLWGGMTIGVAFVGQEPIILALRWLGVDGKKLWIPMLLSNAISVFLYYGLILLGIHLLEA